MISLTERQVNILGELRDTDGYVTVKRLSERFHVSERSIRYDLDFIKCFLHELGVTLIRKQGQGIMLQMHPKQESVISQVLQQMNHLVLSRENLTYALAVQIMMDQETTLDRLGEIYETSKSTIFHYLSSVDDRLKKHGVTVERKRSKGISITGNEIDIRYAFISLINEITEKSHITKQSFIKIFAQERVNKAKAFIKTFEARTQIQFSDSALKELVLIICYQMSRIAKDHYVAYPFIEVKNHLNSFAFEWVKEQLQSDTTHSFPDDEVVFTLKQFKLSKITSAPIGEENFVVDDETYQVSLYFAKEASKAIGINFTKDDEFIHALTYHLRVALNRMKHHLPIENALTEQVKYKFRFIYEITRKIVIKLEQHLGITFPEEEIAFIAMHLGASYERHSATGYMPTALIVCGSGLATSSLLASRLKVMMPEIKCDGPINLSNLQTFDLSTIDFIISTVPIDFSKRKVIVVNPLLESDDLIRLRKLLFRKVYQKQMNDLLEINQPTATLEALIPKNHIQLNIQPTDWRTAIAHASNPLLRHQNITEKYVDAMIKAVEELGPYMVFIPNVAIVHASYKDGVNKDGMSLLTLKEPIIFGDRTDVTVKVIIVMCATKADSDHFIKLVKLLDNKDNMNTLKQATRIDELLLLNNRNS
ncbi:BglG family transcription antiterminator [Sporolactobacillus shoreicorticis]|uniref:BglG family transcription antiterminator n=1 Tax=Sporolactobacillus shoreicorticis TaxID=1923877 RepID=A0ABW5S3T3_9BACL|nr:BglG family transcription antiterminator [Sporolactobacillus shoreicorticis]MCO7124235.1 BglG family transcription antiterminator [Sporolactobacillus shoreicorticis]